MSTNYTRRDALRLGAGAATASLALGASASTAAAQTDGASDSGGSGGPAGWLDGVDNFDGVVDERGKSEVTVEVGTAGNGGDFGFGPAAVRVDPGTTVVWEWTGNGGSHNVVAEDGSFESELVGDAGYTFERTFDAPGFAAYYCMPHRAMGMKGAVLVGDTELPGAGDVADSGPAAPTFDGWLDGVDNYDGVADERGESEVTVRVGAAGNGGAFAFDPPAVQVDPGTTVRWEWTGDGGSHNVVAEDGSFESDLLGDAGTTFERTFDAAGVTKYACAPHVSLGMKGVVVVGDAVGAGGSGALGTDDYLMLGVGAVALSPLAVALGLLFHGEDRDPIRGRNRGRGESDSDGGLPADQRA
ncbi:halocyanin domain-containing protein [Halobium salinum]|uniref:Halocyanin domain-containing protein n=1 Tax=Halobium salinum TaxID=1364940 RepID=A0ABD5PCV6_9EURY|nr:halocyanin domain-containing protein [Halobium salinum]